jgi:hypothetical protein
VNRCAPIPDPVSPAAENIGAINIIAGLGTVQTRYQHPVMMTR